MNLPSALGLNLTLSLGGNGGGVTTDAPVASAATSVLDESLTANWAAVVGADSYRLDVSTVNTFASFVTGFNDLTVAGTSQAVTGLSAGTTYYYRVRAVMGSQASLNSGVIEIMTLAAYTFTATGNGSASGTLSLYFPNSEAGKKVICTGNVKLGAGGDQTEQTIVAGGGGTTEGLNTFTVWCTSGTGKLIFPNTYTRFAANNSNTAPSNGWAALVNQNRPSLSFNISKIPAAIVTFRCDGSNTISGPLPSDWKVMVYFFCAGLNTILGLSAQSYAYTTTNMKNITLTSSVSGGGLSAAEQEILINGLAGRTWDAGGALNLNNTASALMASMADTAQGGRWGTFTEDPATSTPSTIAISLKSLGKRANPVTETIKGLTEPGLVTGDGVGFPQHFGNWWRVAL